MTTRTLTPNLLKEMDLIVVPRKEYEDLLSLQEMFGRKLAESEDVKDTDEAIRVYKQEKKQKKLRVLKSLADLR
ncbi:MAG: hypothetical protein AAB642_02795 [Patescibacteria group bacterium]